MLNTPQVGTTVNVVVPNTSATRTNPAWFPDEPETLTFTGTVLKPYTWLKAGEFCLSNDDIRFPIRVINMKHVVSIDGADVPAQPSTIQYFNIKGQSGKTYSVVVSGDGATCTCPGYFYRKHCAHIDTAMGKEPVAKPTKEKKQKASTPPSVAKKGSKLETCRKLFSKDKSRAENIRLFVESAGLTSAGASTYYQKLKNEQ